MNWETESDRFVWRHSLESLNLKVTDGNLLSTNEWNLKLKNHSGYNRHQPLALVLHEDFKKKSVLKLNSKEEDKVVITRDGNIAFDNETLLYPERRDILTGMWNDKIGAYDLYLEQDMFIVLGYNQEDGKEFQYPIRYEGAFAAFAGESNVTELKIHQQVAEIQARYLFSQQMSMYFGIKMTTIRREVPEKSLDKTKLTTFERPHVQSRLFHSLQEARPCDGTKFGSEVYHRFKYTSTLSALEMEDGYHLYEKACALSHKEWEKKAAKIFGKECYGNIQIHHVIHANMDGLIDDLKNQDDKGRIYLSETHKNWIWLPKRRTVTTIVWDVAVQCYRFHVKEKACVLIECLPDNQGSLVIPSKIVYISQFQLPMKSATPVYCFDEADFMFVSTIVEKFKETYEKLAFSKYLVY